MGRRSLVVWPAAVAALCAGCGSSTPTPPTTGVTATRPASDLVDGRVVSTRDGTVTLTGSDGVDSQFVATPETPVTRVVSAAAADLTPGTCVVAGGGNTGSAVTAAWVLLEGPAGCARPGAAVVHVPAGLSVVAGDVQSVAGRTVSVHGPEGGTRVALTTATPVGRVLDATAAEVREGQCAVARGRRGHSGRLVARHVDVVPAPAGGCFSGNDGVGALSFVEPRPGAGGEAGSAGSTAGGGGGAGPGPAGVSPGGPVDPSSTARPVPVEPGGTGPGGQTSSPPGPGTSAPPVLMPPPATSSEPPVTAATPAPRPGTRTPAPSAVPGPTGAPQPR